MAFSSYVGVTLLLLSTGCAGLRVSPGLARSHHQALRSYAPVAMAKKGGKKPYGAQQQQGKKGGPPSSSSREAAWDEKAKQFIFTILKLSKTLPDGSRTLLKDINLCFFPGAKIGLVGLNGSGKSTLLKIMAGVDTEFDGTAKPKEGIKIGYLAQARDSLYFARLVS